MSPLERADQVWRRAQAPLALLILVLALATACNPSDGRLGNPRVATIPTPQAAATTPGEGVPVSLLKSAYLQSVYTLVLQRFIDRVDHNLLIEAGLKGMRESLAETGALPLDMAILDLLTKPTASPERDWAAFAAAYDALTRKYPDWAAAVRLDHRVLERMVEALADRHSLFIRPEDYRRRNETGYSGIGVRLSQPSDGRGPRIVEVFPGTPAAQLGLKAGDRIVAVEGQPIAGLSLSKVVDQIRGPEGTAVTMDIERIGAPAVLRASITRRGVEIPLVDAGMFGPMGYLRIRGFSEPVPQLVGAALAEAKRLGARGWVVDLRGNGGGRLTAVQAVAGMFVEARTIGVEVNRNRDRNPLTSQGPRLVEDGPVVVLIDGETTSGAEILSAALREHRKATVIGERTAGNVAVAEEHVMPDGSAIQLTVRRFLGPSGGQIDRVGVQPDFPIQVSDADLAAGRDPQLAKALEVLFSQ